MAGRRRGDPRGGLVPDRDQGERASGHGDANVGATARVLDAAIAAGVPRIVYVSTVNVFGDTHGQLVDETYRRDPGDGFLSWYDETKYRAHRGGREADRRRAPRSSSSMPGQVYGPDDHSELGEQLAAAYQGTLRYIALTTVGVGLVHVDDLADGIVAALDRGRPASRTSSPASPPARSRRSRSPPGSAADDCRA